MEGLFTTVLSMSFAGSWAIAAVLAARLLLKKAPKILSYALWAVVLVRLLMPVSFSSPYFGVPQLQDAPTMDFVQQETAVHAVPPTNFPMQQNQPASSSVSLLLVLSLVWAAGICIMLLYGVISYIKLRKKLVGAIHLRDNIYMADYLATPFVIGFIRPKIFLPSTLEKWEIPYILAHEQHHIWRLDYLAKPFGFLALSVHWFNPLVWLAFLLFCKDMEMSCDEAVIGKLGENVRAEYSAALLSLATGHKTIAGMPLAFGEGDTKGRIRNMKNWKKPVLWIVAIAAVCCLLLGIFLLTNREDAPGSSAPIEEKSYSPLLDVSAADLKNAQEIVDDWSVRADAAFDVAFGIAGDYETRISIGESAYFKVIDPRFSSVEDLNRVLYAACTDSGLRALGMGPADEMYREQDGQLYRLEADYITCQAWDDTVLGIVEQSDNRMVLRMPIAPDTAEDMVMTGASAYDVTFVKEKNLWKLDRQAFYMGELPENRPSLPTSLALTEETANACMTEILNSFRVEQDGTVTFRIPDTIPQSDNEAVCLNIDLYAEFQQREKDISQVLLEQERHWQDGEVYADRLDLSLGELKRIFMRVSFPEVEGDGWKDVFPAKYLELTPPFENRASDTGEGDTISAAQSGSEILVDLTFRNVPAAQLSFTLPKGVVLGEEVNGPDHSGYQLKDESGKEIGEFFFMGLAAGPEDLQNIDTAAPQLPMQIFAGVALPNHVMYDNYQVQAFTATGAAATALFSSQDLSLMDKYGSAVEIPFDNRKNLTLFYDYEKLPVFLQISFDEAVVSQSVCAEIAKSVQVKQA